MPTLLLLRGLPGAGTSTEAKEKYVPQGYIHLEPAWYFYKNGKFVYVPNRMTEAYKWCRDLTYDALLAGRDVVVAGWFIRKCEVRAYQDLANHCKANLKIITLRTRFRSKHLTNQATYDILKANWEEIEDVGV